MNPEQLYNQFSGLDPASKLLFTLFFGLVIFLYKTFFSMFSEEDKQIQPLKFKAGELLGKLESAIIIYENSQKDRSAKDKLIEKFGECYVFFSWELKKKVRMFYENQSDQTLTTIKSKISSEVDSFPTFGEKTMLLDQIFALIGKLFKPILPLVSLIVLLFGLGSNYLAFSSAESFWSKSEVMTRYASVTISIVFFLTTLNIFLENRWKRRVGILPWLFIVGVITCPYIFYMINNKLIAYSILLQVVFFVALFKIKFNTDRSSSNQ